MSFYLRKKACLVMVQKRIYCVDDTLERVERSLLRNRLLKAQWVAPMQAGLDKPEDLFSMSLSYPFLSLSDIEIRISVSMEKLC